VRRIAVTGAEGFIGSNLVQGLSRLEGVDIIRVEKRDDGPALGKILEGAHVVFHLAGINRPEITGGEFGDNPGFTERLLSALENVAAGALIVYASSTQAELDNPYGASKRSAENLLLSFKERVSAKVLIFRLPNVFGKWAKPGYNSVVATFCSNIAHGKKIEIHDPDAPLRLVYIDTIVNTFCRLAEERDIPQGPYLEIGEEHRTTVGELANILRAFYAIRNNGVIPDLARPLVRYLYATYTSYIPEDELAYSLPMHTDQRGSLFELVKTASSGQIFVSTTKPGIIRGNHFHDTKCEKFCVVRGKGLIRLRHVVTGATRSYDVSGDDVRIVDIPPGFAHSISNVGTEDMITLFWASEVFDSKRPDTFSADAERGNG
jgi:UDP-2-acetamido-2,6-beta-L-arabino-hexul-4-ose reductase